MTRAPARRRGECRERYTDDGFISAYTLRTYTAGASSGLTSHLSNEFRLNYSFERDDIRYIIDPFGGSTSVDLLQLTGLGTGAEPQVALYYSGYQVFLDQARQSGAQKQWNLVDAFGSFLGHHQFKFGVDYRRLAPFAGYRHSRCAYYLFQ